MIINAEERDQLKRNELHRRMHLRALDYKINDQAKEGQRSLNARGNTFIDPIEEPERHSNQFKFAPGQIVCLTEERCGNAWKGSIGEVVRYLYTKDLGYNFCQVMIS